MKSARIATTREGIPTPRPTPSPILSPRSMPSFAGQLHVEEGAEVELEVVDEDDEVEDGCVPWTRLIFQNSFAVLWKGQRMI